LTWRARTPELPAPALGGEALVRVEASGVSFAEQQMRLGKHYDQPNFPFVPGYDLVGVVEQIGADAAGGRAMSASVSAWPPLAKTGGWADRVLLEARGLRVVRVLRMAPRMLRTMRDAAVSEPWSP
jgi:NADPH:quinone reductase-like Zn-dependent oxidoreductase